MKNHSDNFIFCRAIISYDNLGDIVINKTLMNNLRNYGRLIVNTRGVPPWVCQQLELSVDEQYTKGIGFQILVFLYGLRALADSNSKVYFIKTPGGYIGNDLNNNWLNQVKGLAWVFLFRIIGVRVCWFGASIESFSKMQEMLEKWKSQFIYFYSVRDSLSQDYGRKIGIERLAIFPDLAWLMETSSENSNPISIDGEYVIFSFRKPPQRLINKFNLAEYENDFYRVLDAIIKLVCQKWSKKLVICYQVTRDYKFCKEIKDRYQDSCDVILIDHQINTESIYGLYSRASMVFSNRLHVLLFSGLYGSLPVAVINTELYRKITGIFLDAKLMRLIVDISKKPDLVELLSGMVADTSLIKEKIASYHHHQLNTGQELFKLVMTGSKHHAKNDLRNKMSDV
jgi:polysaccharide pyruvyl transferase WcaK-like protein